MQKLLVKKLTPTAKLPTRAYKNDAGLDLYADEDKILEPNKFNLIKTGISLAIPENCAGLVWDKSGLAKSGLHALAGVIDAGYRGEILINLINLSSENYNIQAGQKIAQLLIQEVKLPEIIEMADLEDSDRGEKGHGSSGLK